MKLSPAENKALEMAFLGGMGALRTDTYHCDCKTVDSLMLKGFFDKQGLTVKGKRKGEKLANLMFLEAM